jgi:hypothetical protein
MTEFDWKPWDAADKADAELGEARRLLRQAYAHNDAKAQTALEKFQAASVQIDRAMDAIENPDE